MREAKALAYGWRMRCLGLTLGLLLTPAMILLPTATAVAEEQAEVDTAYVKVALTREGKTYAHPGFRVAKGEEGVFEIECSGKTHEVAVVLRGGTAELLQLTVEYSVDGRSVLRQELEVTAGKDVEVGKGDTKLAINADPRGKKDTSRKDQDKIDAPGGDDPL